MAAVFLVIVVHLSTIRLSPVIWIDEVQIVELGRAFLDPQTSWSVNWDVNRAARGLAYLGSAGEELAYRIAGGSMRGPRVFSLMGAVFVGVTALYWLSARTEPASAALLASLILLIDPLFVENYRGARVDSWAIGCGLWACGLLRRAATDGALPVNRRLLFIGFLAGLLPFIWPSSVLLLPLLAVEAVPVIWRNDPRQSTPVRALALLIGGAAISVMLALLPVGGQFGELIQRTLSRAAIDLGARETLARTLTRQATMFAVLFRQTPWLLLFGTAGLLVRREWRLFSALALILGFMLMTRLYQHRFVYLLPYLAVGFADLFAVLAARPTRAATIRNVCLALTIMWAVGSLGARSALAFAEREDRNPDRLFVFARRAAVPEGARVYLGSWEMYYPGRALNWRLYKLVSGRERCDNNAFPNLLATMDFAIFAAESLPDGIEQCLAETGLRRGPTLEDGHSGAPLRMLGRQWGATPYGSYILYVRAEPP